jgi:hypothetical protein
MGKVVWGRVRVAFNSGAGDIESPFRDADFLINQFKRKKQSFPR